VTGSATATVAPEDVRETELACFCALKPVVDLDWDPHAAFTQLELFRSGIEPNLRAEVQALPSGHPYLRLPLHFSNTLEGPLRSFVNAEELRRLQEQAETELRDPNRWGITFTLIQSCGRRAA
jgi:hypothetical protein